MKTYGSNVRDTLVGTASNDTIKALGGNDLIATAGGVDTILAGDGNDLITGFSYKLTADKGDTDIDTGTDPGTIGDRASRADSSASIKVDGGQGSHDIIVVELTAAKGTSNVDDFKKAVTVKNVEEFIYNFDSLSASQKLLGSNRSEGIETIVVGAGNANIDTRAGSDFVYTADGNDVIKAGAGSDFIHAGNGHNIVSGGSGTDYFHFHLTGSTQHTEITDFEEGIDKILISVDTTQINLIFGLLDEDWESLEEPLPERGYGDGYLGVGPEINSYVSYNHGREFDPSNFTQDDDTLFPNLWAYYELATGSIFARHYEEHASGLELETVLLAHVEPGTDIAISDILFRMI